MKSTAPTSKRHMLLFAAPNETSETGEEGYEDTAHQEAANERVLHSAFIGLSEEGPRSERQVKGAKFAWGGIL